MNTKAIPCYRRRTYLKYCSWKNVTKKGSQSLPFQRKTSIIIAHSVFVSNMTANLFRVFMWTNDMNCWMLIFLHAARTLSLSLLHVQMRAASDVFSWIPYVLTVPFGCYVSSFKFAVTARKNGNAPRLYETERNIIHRLRSHTVRIHWTS